MIMSQTTTPRKVPCTYRGCRRFFPSVNEMKKHKAHDPAHEYCERCDEDFEDEERLLIHKIKSNRHVVCPICGIEFRSEGGRDVHIRQFHRSVQTLKCPGCEQTFKSASGLMRHVEDDECDQISQTRLLQEQTKKIIIKDALKVGEGAPKPVLPNASDFDDIEGGVKISALEMANREAMANQPKSTGDDAASSVSASLSLKHWPTLGGSSRGNASFPDQRSSAASDLMAFSEISRTTTATNLTIKGKGNHGKESVDLLTDASKPASESGDASQFERSTGAPLPSNPTAFGLDLNDPGLSLRLLHQDWDATRFFNSFAGQYICPCGTGFAELKKFEFHVLNESQKKRIMQCPGCFKSFKSTAALVAHCEAASTKCDISSANQFGQIIDEVSGGLIQVAGHNSDGTVKYEAGTIDLQKTTTIGPHLSRNLW